MDIGMAEAGSRGGFARSGSATALRRGLATLGSLLVTLILSAALVFAVELIARGGSIAATVEFMERPPFRPGFVTVVLFALLALFFDALLGRRHRSFLLMAPVMLGLAFVDSQKAHYLGDPLYPTDFLYAHQIVELLPLLLAERPLAALLAGLGGLMALTAMAGAWIFWRDRFAPLSLRGRFWRLAVAMPALAFFVSIMDYASFSWTRDRLRIIPKMWDQKANYASNGFALAFALNLPMAKVLAPAGYSAGAIDALSAGATAVAAPAQKPDIIMVMSESFWDPTRLPGVAITPDPLPTARALGSGQVFSPEFGGMTANVEFEALTGFSNAFLPYGSIPYQQYVRGEVPSLAGFLRDQGYQTAAIHPFAGWFWNRSSVYEALGFDMFYSQENLPPLEKRGKLASDAALTEEIIRRAEIIGDRPMFLFAVSLQSHGPYEPDRYKDTTLRVESDMTERSEKSLLTFAEGISDADKGLARLVGWAKTRARPTVIVFFGDHLPPLNKVYVETGFMKDTVPERREPVEQLTLHRETPLVIWSSRGGTVPTGTVSPAYVPLYLMQAAGFEHPYYTGFLRRARDSYPVIDRHTLIGEDGTATPDWSRGKALDPVVRDFRMLQYDVMFGKQRAKGRFFPARGRPQTG